MSSASLDAASEPTPSYDDVATRPPVAVRDGEMPGKSVESMSADEIAATQASEVAITVGDPVPAGEQNATVEIQGQPIGRSLSRQLTTSISGLQRSVSNPGAAAGNARARTEARVANLPGAGVVGAAACCILVVGVVFIAAGVTPGAIILNLYYETEGKPCSSDVSKWMYITGWLVIATAAWGCILNSVQIMNKKGDGEEGASNPCLSCVAMIMSCGSCGASIFGSYWFIYGNMQVWHNQPYNETQLAMIAANGTVLGSVEPTFDLGPAAFLGEGCDPDMWNGARTYLIVMLSLAGGLPIVCCILACCCMCVGMAAGGNSD